MVGAFDKVKQLVASRSLELRREVVKTVIELSESGDPSLFQVYQELLYDTDADIRLMAVTSLAGYVGDPRTAPAVGGAVTDENLKVKLKPWVSALRRRQRCGAGHSRALRLVCRHPPSQDSGP